MYFVICTGTNLWNTETDTANDKWYPSCTRAPHDPPTQDVKDYDVGQYEGVEHNARLKQTHVLCCLTQLVEILDDWQLSMKLYITLSGIMTT